jgi:MSHA biogenesis protein MshL
VQLRAVVRDSASLCSKLLRNKDFQFVRRACLWGCVPVALAATAGSAGQQTGGRPPELAVTQLQGPKPTGTAPAPGGTRAPIAGVSPLPVTRLDDRQPEANLDGARRITLSVSRPMPIGDLLLLLVNGTPFSLVSADDVTGTFTGDLKELTMRQALEAVLFPRGFDYDVQGTLLRVFPRRTSTRLFTINYLNVRRTLERSVTNPAAVGSSNAPATQLTTVSSSDFYDDVQHGVQSLLSASGRVHIDRTAGLVHVTDFPERLDQVGVYLETMQLRATRQVRLDAQLLSVALWPGGGASIDWATPALKKAAVVRATSGNGPVGLSVTNLDALTKALAEQGTVTTIASPHIVAMNNEPAVVRVGKELAYFDSRETSTEHGEKRAVSAATVLDGLTLTLVAQVSADDFVQLHVSPAYAAQSGESRARDGTTVPVLAVNQADTVMRVRDGETIVFAGFLSAAENATPRSGFARLFGAGSRTTVRSELVILLTPRIVKAATLSSN